jgi:AraC family ethanolamine operon transcriptional activator
MGSAAHKPLQPLQPTSLRPRQDQHYRQIVDRIENLARARAEELLHIEDHCNAADVSQRILRKAFQAMYASPPYCHLRALRMTEARKALLSPGGSTQTVTQVAMRFGFLELGRFSVEYRLMFGECPSATLRRTVEALRDVASMPSQTEWVPGIARDQVGFQARGGVWEERR